MTFIEGLQANLSRARSEFHRARVTLEDFLEAGGPKEEREKLAQDYKDAKQGVIGAEAVLEAGRMYPPLPSRLN